MKTAVAQIRRSAQFLLTLISDLLDLSRVEAGATKLEPVPTDLGGLDARNGPDDTPTSPTALWMYSVRQLSSTCLSNRCLALRGEDLVGSMA